MDKQSRDLPAQFERWITEGMHALIIKDEHQTTVQPLTERGLEAIRAICGDAGMSADFLVQLGRKRHGHYLAAVPMENSPETIAQMLVMRYGLPDGSVKILEVPHAIIPKRI